MTPSSNEPAFEQMGSGNITDKAPFLGLSAKTPDSAAPIKQELDKNEISIIAADKLLDKLIDRLTPILGKQPKDNTPEKQEVPIDPDCSDIERLLKDQHKMICIMHDKLEMAIKALRI